jgi:hypothetical protein
MDMDKLARDTGIDPKDLEAATREAEQQEATARDEARYYSRQAGVGFHPDDMDREAED